MPHVPYFSLTPRRTLLHEQGVAEEPLDRLHDGQPRRHSDVTTRSSDHRAARRAEVRPAGDVIAHEIL